MFNCVILTQMFGHVPVRHLEKTFSKILEKFGIEVPRKDCHQVLSVKKDIQKITATDLDPCNTTIKPYLSESLCLYYRILWSKSKGLFTMSKIRNYFISSETLRERCLNTEFFLGRIFPYSVRIRENTEQEKLRIWTRFIQCENRDLILHIQLILKRIFLVWT